MSTSRVLVFSITTGADVPTLPPTVTTTELHRKCVRAEPLWLIYVPDVPGIAPSQIPGSLTTTDEALLAALATETPMVLYGDDKRSRRARTLASRLSARGRDAWWYVGGLEAWIAAGHPLEEV